MIDFAMMETIRDAANIVQHNIWITKGAKVTIGVDGEPEWHNRFANKHLSFASLAQSEKTLLALMDENQNAIMADCQDRHDNGLDLFPQLKTLIDRLVAVQWTIAQCGSYSIFEEMNQERPSFNFPDPTTDQVISQIRRWLGWFDYYFPGCLSDYKTNCNIPGMEGLYYPGCMIGHRADQNGGHTEPPTGLDNKSNAIDVDGRENAPKWPLPGWLPRSIYDGWEKQRLIDGNLWKGKLYELVSELANISDFIVGRNKDGENEYRWNLADGVFDYYAKDGQQRTALTENLRDACKYAKNKGIL